MAGLGRVTGSVILDSQGLVKLAMGDFRARAFVRDAIARKAEVVTAATTLAEVLRGRPADAAIHHALARVSVLPITEGDGRAAGELLGRVGLDGHRCALDALLAVIALAQPRPAVLLTSDPADLAQLTDEPERPKADRIAIVRV